MIGWCVLGEKNKILLRFIFEMHLNPIRLLDNIKHWIDECRTVLTWHTLCFHFWDTILFFFLLFLWITMEHQGTGYEESFYSLLISIFQRKSFFFFFFRQFKNQTNFYIMKMENKFRLLSSGVILTRFHWID